MIIKSAIFTVFETREDGVYEQRVQVSPDAFTGDAKELLNKVLDKARFGFENGGGVKA